MEQRKAIEGAFGIYSRCQMSFRIEDWTEHRRLHLPRRSQTAPDPFYVEKPTAN